MQTDIHIHIARASSSIFSLFHCLFLSFIEHCMDACGKRKTLRAILTEYVTNKLDNMKEIAPHLHP